MADKCKTKRFHTYVYLNFCFVRLAVESALQNIAVQFLITLYMKENLILKKLFSSLESSTGTYPRSLQGVIETSCNVLVPFI